MDQFDFLNAPSVRMYANGESMVLLTEGMPDNRELGVVFDNLHIAHFECPPVMNYYHLTEGGYGAYRATRDMQSAIVNMEIQATLVTSCEGPQLLYDYIKNSLSAADLLNMLEDKLKGE